MVPEPTAIVQKVWSFCHVLKHDGVSYGDYLEQLTYLLFLKMADERTRPPFNHPSVIPEGLRWPDLAATRGEALEAQYRRTLEVLGKEDGLLGVIYRKAQNKIGNPANLKRLVDHIGEENWTGLGVDIKGEIYEGLLAKNAEDVKSGAGQYFTPRTLIHAIVDVMHPAPGEIIVDPACGTGGFLLAAYDYVFEHHNLDRDQKRTLSRDSLFGTELVDSTARLAVMNMFLHGIGGEISPITPGDALVAHPGWYCDMVLANPPFGSRTGLSLVDDDGESETVSSSYDRDDFWATTSNKQLNFLQHIRSILKVGGRAAVVLPDNVLYVAGAGETIRRKLLSECNLHTVLRLPTGIFYKPGVKANVLFFDKRPPREAPWTSETWYYDLRTNMHFTLKASPLTAADLQDFVDCYKADAIHERVETERFKKFTYAELSERDKVNLDIKWLKDDALENVEHLPQPAVIAAEIVENLRAALDQFEEVAAKLNGGE